MAEPGAAPMATQTIDTRGLKCPIPVLRARKAMRALGAGDVLEVLATDPGTVKDFQAFSDATGHAVIEATEQAGEFRFLIRKSV